MVNNSTIAAICTGLGEGSIGIVRVSGKDTINTVDKIFKSKKYLSVLHIPVRYAVLGKVIDDKGEIDEVLLLKFIAPNSYTGENVIEIHCHGGQIVLRRILNVLLRNGAYLAQPGEFTKRAFLNGKIDLIQAESVIDIINAKTDAALQAANRGLSGILSSKVHTIRNEILFTVAHIEATIDYPEDGIENIQHEEILSYVTKWDKQLNDILVSANRGNVLRNGLLTIILGRPNVGKSSLLNFLLGQERAIVTKIPGTTRDIIEEYIDIEGIPIKLIDTAGIRKTSNPIEQIGIERALKVSNEADLILYILDYSENIHKDDIRNLKNLEKKNILYIVNKIDLPKKLNFFDLTKSLSNKHSVVYCSAQTGYGLDTLIKSIKKTIENIKGAFNDEEIMATDRQLEKIYLAKKSLKNIIQTIHSKIPLDCITIDLQDGCELLGEITGESIQEDLIETIFKEFCVGK